MKKQIFYPAAAALLLSLSSTVALADGPNDHNAPQQPNGQQQYQQGNENQGHNNHTPNNNGVKNGNGHAKHMSSNQHEERFIRVSSARLRSGPGTNYPIMKGLHRGDRVKVVKVENNWAQVAIGTTLMWVAADLLTSK